MTILRVLAVFSFIIMGCLSPSTAQAEPKWWIFGWNSDHWYKQDFQPYLENGHHPHNSQWDNKDWEPEDWIAQRSTSHELVDGFYRANIIDEQLICDDIPVLKVGPGFYRLGGHDKRRVTETLDHIYQITSRSQNGVFMLRDWKSNKTIGSYTKYGLQIQ